MDIVYATKLIAAREYGNPVGDEALKTVWRMENGIDGDEIVYLFHAIGTDLYKIGMTGQDVENRLSQVNSHSPVPVRLVAVKYCHDAKKYEKALHDECHRYRKHGEWFEFNQDELNAVLEVYDCYYEK